MNTLYPQNGVSLELGQNPQMQVPLVTTMIPQTIKPVLGPFPSLIKCPHCMTAGISEVIYVTGLGTYLLAGGCCLLGLWLCCCIPFCLNSTKDAHHYCPNCKNFLGRFRKVGS
ncbi:hypothetical protein FO519_002649 [Halicephalobus sp. NKZ332]|nr:hypothetical protein FO519_002649 [Halicephalobus sp. NKZ332]